MGGKWVERGEENIVGMGKVLTCSWKNGIWKMKIWKVYWENIFYYGENKLL